MPFRSENRHLTVSLIAIVASLFVVAIGAQAYLARQDDAARDAADRRYADCLTEFAADLVDTLEVRARTTAELDKLRDEKDDLLDRLFELQARADASGARSNEELERLEPGLLEEYRDVIRRRVEVQAEFRRAEREAARARVENPYIAPEVRCTR